MRSSSREAKVMVDCADDGASVRHELSEVLRSKTTAHSWARGSEGGGELTSFRGPCGPLDHFSTNTHPIRGVVGHAKW